SDVSATSDRTPRPAAFAPPIEQMSDLARLSGSLGLPSEANGLAGAPGTERSYELTVRTVNTALWGASFGFYLGQVLNPLVTENALGDTRVHVREFLRPAGPL